MLPVWLMRGRVIIGISSPKGKNNYFAKLFFATYPDTKEPIFNTLVFTGACQKCTDNKKTDTCNHEPWRYPSYLQVNTKMEGIRLTMDQDVETFNREQKGIITDDAKGTYVPYKYIEKLKANAPFEWKGQPQPKFVVIGVDPNSGGSSDASFVALASVRGQVVVVGLESYPCEDAKQIEILFLYFIKALYKHPWLNKAIFVLLVERNIVAGPYAIENVLQNYPRHYIISDRVRDVSGYWTDRKMKVEYVVSGAAQLREDKISFMVDLVCANPWMDSDSRANLMIQKLLEQIPRFRLKDAPIGSSNRLPKLSGKFDENGKEVKGAKDDLAFAMFMALYMLDGILKEEIPGIDYRFVKQEG